MKCPICTEQRLKPLYLEKNLPAARCGHCLGTWIQGRDYQHWLQTERPAHEEPSNDSGMERVSGEVRKAKLCPSCFRILSKYDVGKGTNFSLERCISCGGIWFDRNEWEILQDKNLHETLDTIFTSSYQKYLREEESRKVMETLCENRFGTADYKELRRIRLWLETHEKRDEMLAYLTDPDPTKA